jgi:ATP-dependent protease Clp ATPase subunit
MTVICSFCHKTVSEVKVMISNHHEVTPPAYICDECVAICSDIVWEKKLAISAKKA